MYKHILIPTDGSTLSDRAARAGVKLAATLGARVTALFVAPPATPVVYERLLPVKLTSPDEHAALIARAAERCLGVVRKAAEAAGVACDCISLTGDFPAEAIMQTAAKRKCDLIFMASHGRRGVAAVLLGSQTHKVLAQAKVAVLVHRERVAAT
jgi:nucleotide-binding universal stress UspA family protein